MPPKRRTSTPRTASQRQQSTLSFAGRNSRVIKASSPRTTRSKKDSSLFQDVDQIDIKTDAEPALDKPTTADAELEQQVQSYIVPDPLESNAVDVKTVGILGGRADESELGAIGGDHGSGWDGDEQHEARKISQAQINKYWRGKEQERKAPRLHQQGLGVHEKILREWDMSGQYGPCIGIARLKRWKRANMLGLHPPMEVLAVLLKEMDSGETRFQRAHVDELMNSRFIET